MPNAPDRRSVLGVAPEVQQAVALARDWRRRLHSMPELAFAETCTSDFIARALDEAGIEVHRGVGGTGVVGVMRRGRSPRSIGLRAEMDALPIQEARDVPYRSRHAGCMHACGHDGHSAMLLAAGWHLARAGRFDGTVHLIFQPAEETGGGALAMLRDGLFERFPCDAIYAMHNRPSLPVGHFAVRSGPAMAAGGFFDIRVRGRSAHAARPETGVDCVLAAARIVSDLQGIAARTVSAVEPAVVTVTRIQGGDAYNVMPDEVLIGGTLRVTSRPAMSRLEEALRRTSSLVAQAHGASAEIHLRWVFPPTINDPDHAARLAKLCSQVAGEERVQRDWPVAMASDDFGHMLEDVAGCYFHIGTGEGEGSCEVHNPDYDFNDAALEPGIRLLVELVGSALAP